MELDIFDFLQSINNKYLINNTADILIFCCIDQHQQ